jgi:hypothetical protein
LRKASEAVEPSGTGERSRIESGITDVGCVGPFSGYGQSNNHLVVSEPKTL